jgi:Rod binding domain-containing protein
MMTTTGISSKLTSMDNDMLAINNSTQRAANAAKAKLATKGLSEAKIDAVAHEFEAQFISQMLENMFSNLDTKDALGGSNEEETYRSLLVDEYGKMIARTGGIGVADHVKREMLQMQEVSLAK